MSGPGPGDLSVSGLSVSGLSVAGCTVLAAVLLIWPPRRSPAPSPKGPARSAGKAERPERTRLLLALMVGLAVAGLIGTLWGVPAGMAAGIGTDRFLRTREPAAARRERDEAAADLPLGADLLAAALKGGTSVDTSIAAVAEAIGGALGARLQRTARSLRLGAAPGEAWAHLAGVPQADRLIAAAVRSSASGGALSGALERIAGDLRSDRTVAVEAAAQRAGVLVVLPLGLCFLPAFLLAGLTPVLVAIFREVM
ncbi:type II secretion system F family protein [Actinoplanes sp. G11-F43]|uniref:type II secretion system F family protein n=1 Tax=Actinoplanes sp. G11-F43 TaxID=3424130 RepID=UPI003D33FD3A